MENLTINASQYTPDDTGSDSASDSGETHAKSNTNLALRRLKLNQFLIASGKTEVRQPKKKWEQLSSRTKNHRIQEAKDGVVAVLEVVAPEAAPSLWEALKESRCVENTLAPDSNVSQYDEKYLKALSESYENAESWDTRRQILSIIADLVPYHVIQKYIPGITSFRIKTARHHRLQYGRGSSLSITKSPRMRVDSSKLDHFISFIISPHVVQDLPFGQRYLHLSEGRIIETPNVIRKMIPQRIISQYDQFCKETSFIPFSRSTLLRILSSCAATVRKSLQGLDYFAADGAKAFDDLKSITLKLEENGAEKHWVDKCERALMEGKQYLKTDYKVFFNLMTANPPHGQKIALQYHSLSRTLVDMATNGTLHISLPFDRYLAGLETKLVF